MSSANFPESEIVAELYAGALESAGVQTETSLGIKARQTYARAVQEPLLHWSAVE